MANKDNTQNWITLEEAAEVIGVETRSATHVEGTRPDGTNLCLKAQKL